MQTVFVEHDAQKQACWEDWDGVVHLTWINWQSSTTLSTRKRKGNYIIFLFEGNTGSSSSPASTGSSES